MENVYKNLSSVSVTDKVEKKGRFNYLSWAWAWHFLKQEYPDAQRIVYENAEGVPYFTDGKYANVKVGIVVKGQEHIDYLPVLDNANRSIPLAKLNAFDINNTIQRATAKAIAMHGLGLSLWIGEDTARQNSEPQPQINPNAKDIMLDFAKNKKDGNWDKVMNFIAGNKEKGLKFIVERLSTKYEMEAFDEQGKKVNLKTLVNKKLK